MLRQRALVLSNTFFAVDNNLKFDRAMRYCFPALNIYTNGGLIFSTEVQRKFTQTPTLLYYGNAAFVFQAHCKVAPACLDFISVKCWSGVVDSVGHGVTVYVSSNAVVGADGKSGDTTLAGNYHQHIVGGACVWRHHLLFHFASDVVSRRSAIDKRAVCEERRERVAIY